MKDFPPVNKTSSTQETPPAKEILRLNAISPAAYEYLPKDYALTESSKSPVGVLVRSAKMHDLALPESVLAVARAGAGVNNIPVEAYAARGVVVFNTPGANANAVKELTIAALLLASRKIADGIAWVNTLSSDPDPLKTAEKGKSAFVGPELAGKKLGVIGLGAIGAPIANAAVSLGMEVYGYDPYISVEAAWRLSRAVKHETDFDRLLSLCDYVTVHVPFTGENKGLFNAGTIAKMKPGSALINLSRGELVDNAAVLAALESGALSRYVTDFPAAELIGKPNVVCMPHLGASTPEAEDNCAAMAARELVDYIENGTIKNSVNYPAISLPRSGNARVSILHKNQKNMISAITAVLSSDNKNIENFVNKSRGEYACSLLDLDAAPGEAVLAALRNIDGVILVRAL